MQLCKGSGTSPLQRVFAPHFQRSSSTWLATNRLLLAEHLACCSGQKLKQKLSTVLDSSKGLELIA